MLKVRFRHEDAAKRAVAQAETALGQAQNNHEAAIAERKRYQEWMVQERENRYAAILHKKVSPADLGKFRESLAVLAQGLVDRDEKVRQAEEAVNLAKQKVDQARADYFAARRETMKIEEHRKIWLSLAQKEEERVSDLEMEESVRFSVENDE